jgi:hypothetical protein
MAQAVGALGRAKLRSGLGSHSRAGDSWGRRGGLVSLGPGLGGPPLCSESCRTPRTMAGGCGERTQVP